MRKPIPGHFNYADLYDSVAARLPRGCRVVEVGSWQGASVVHLADALAGKDATVFSVDNGIGTEHSPTLWHVGIERLRRNVADAGVLVLPVDSLLAARAFSPHSVDFVFIDAGHTYEAVKADVAAWYPIVKPGGILAGHDYSNPEFPGVRRAVDELLGPCLCPINHSCWEYQR
jgi:predicted O-methyltransferase YrrM